MQIFISSAPLHLRKTLPGLCAALVLLLTLVPAGQKPSAATPEPPSTNALTDAIGYTYLPFITGPQIQDQSPVPTVQTVNAPYFAGDIPFAQRAIFWFGRVNSTENYVDVRVGYNNQELLIYPAAFDRRLWHDMDPSPGDLTDWDAVTLYLDSASSGSPQPGPTSYRFTAQLSKQSDDSRYELSARGNGAGWVVQDIPFFSQPTWSGDNPNNNNDDRGWGTAFGIPFTSLGLAGPPHGSQWRLALVLHDRDDEGGTAIADKIWPASMSSESPASWGRLVFGLPEYTQPSAAPAGTVTIRHGLNGSVVKDAAVGGHSLCGGFLDYWTEWGDMPEGVLNPAHTQVNVQNQANIADWPCFSKYYVTFPLNAIPPGKVILSATLTLHQFGNAGDPGQAKRSLIQVMTVNQDWDETTLTWNNAPQAWENVSRAPVDPLLTNPGALGIPWTWDLSYAVAQAYPKGGPLRLVLYSADYYRHSGKYFYSSDVDDWIAEARPTLEVIWGNP